MKSASLNIAITARTAAPLEARIQVRRATHAECVGRRKFSLGRLTWLLTFKEFSDRFRSGWVLACVLVWLGAITLTSIFGLLQIGRIGVLGYDRTVISMLNLVQYLVPLLGLLLGHDLIAGEKEERTLRLLLASGLSRSQLLFGKFFGACLTLAIPLLVGFLLAGTMIGISAKDTDLASFVKIAGTSLFLGFVLIGLGLMLSCVSRTRVQSLVLALLAWCMFVFVYDLVALGIVVSTKSPAATQEIEAVCDAMHVNAAADIHSETGPDNVSSTASSHPATRAVAQTPALLCVAGNPVDVFRAVNLNASFAFDFPPSLAVASLCVWLTAPLLFARWRLNRTDL